MKVVRPLLIVLSAVALAAHFSRMGMTSLAIVSILMPLLLFIRRQYITRLVQLWFWLGAIEWLRILVVYARQRQAAGMPWLRLAVILVVVAMITGASGWLSGRYKKSHTVR
jgi:hypothetical protein